MEASASVITSKTPMCLHVKDPFGGKERLVKKFVRAEVNLAPTLDSQLWSRLSEEVLLQIFARLPVKVILRMRSLNKTWRSTITSPHFQAAFEGALLVRIALMVHDKADRTMFLTQDDGQECFRPGIARCRKVVSTTHVAATINGLVCVIENKKKVRSNPVMLEIRVFVMNVATGICRALPQPREMTVLPSFVRMDVVPEGGYTIAFLHTAGGSMSWEVYKSVENRWSIDDEDSMAHLNDAKAFTMYCMPSSFYANVSTFFPKAKCVKTFDLQGRFCGGEYIAHAVDDISGDLYTLCERGGQHGVWRTNVMSYETSTWELVCKCPELEGTWACLRVVNDVVILLLKLPYHRQPDAQRFGVLGIEVGTIVKAFHMLTKSWHSFPENDYVVQNWGCQ